MERSWGAQDAVIKDRAMTRPLSGLRAITLALVGVAMLGVGCDEKKATESSPSAEAGASTDKYAMADPKLAKALQTAASAAAPDENGPPPAGIFAPGVADRRHAKGAPTTVDMVSDGNEPRVALTAASPEPVRSSYGPAAMELGMQTGPRMAAPTVDLGLALGSAKKEEGGTDWLVADVKKAYPAKDQAGELPPGTDQAIALLGGSQIRIKLGPDGAESELQSVLGKQAPPELDRLTESAAEALVFASVPLPPKPVGVGAQWIAETRMPLSSLDVIAYRAFRVKGIDGNRVHLSFDLKAYAASPSTTLGVPKEATMEQVDAQAQGEMEMVRGEVLARKSDVQTRVVMVFDSPSAAEAPDPSADPGQPAPGRKTLSAQLQSHATFVRGDDLRAAMRP
jgi:hypothetical protein